MKKIIRKEKIENKLKLIADSVEIVKENLPSSFEEFKVMGLKKDGIYKRIEDIIQNIIDICNIINSDFALGMISEEISSIDNLVKNKIIPMKFGEIIKEMKSFRNILVHEYGEIDDAIAFENIKNWLKHFTEFIEIITKILKKY